MRSLTDAGPGTFPRAGFDYFYQPCAGASMYAYREGMPVCLTAVNMGGRVSDIYVKFYVAPGG